MAEPEDAAKKNEHLLDDATIGRVVRRIGSWIVEKVSLRRLATAGVVLIVGGGGGFALRSGSDDPPPATKSFIHITSPVSGSLIQRCVSVTGTARFSSGDEVWLLVQGFSPALYYMEGLASTGATTTSGEVTWSFNTRVGGEKGSGVSYKIVAIVVSSEMGKFLQGMRDVQTSKSNIGHIANNVLPADVKAQDNSQVRRTEGAADNCPSGQN